MSVPVVVVPVALVFLVEVASAQQETSSAVALIVPQAEAEADAILVDAIRAQLSDLPVVLSVESVATLPASLPAQVAVAREVAARLGALSVFWFDLSVPDQVFLYLAEPGGGRVLVRTVEAGGEAERSESVAVIVRGAVRAMMIGGRIGIEVPEPAPPEAPRVPEEPAPAPPPLAAEWLGVRLAYAADFFSDAAVVLHGLDAAVVFHVHPNVSLFAGYRILSAAEASGWGVSLSVARHPFEGGVQFRWPFGDWALGTTIAGTLDYVTRAATTTSAGLATAPEDGRLAFAFGVMAHVAYRVRGPFCVFLDAGLDVDADMTDYVVEIGSQRHVLLSTWQVRPRALLGIAVDLL